MTLDIHAHTVPEGFVAEMRRAVPSAAPELVQRDGAWWLEYPGGRVSGPVPAGMFDLAARLADMDAAGVDVQALSVPPPHFGYRLEPQAAAEAARLHNDAMVQMAREVPDRFVVLGHLPMQSVEHALAELERLVAVPEVVGLELGTNVAGVNLGAPVHEAVWEAVDATGLAVVLHPGADVAGADRMQEHYLHNFVGNPTDSTVAAGSLIFSGVLQRNTALRIGLLHGGGFLPYQIGRFDHGWSVRPEARQHLDVAPSTLLGRFWFDTLTHDALSLRMLADRVGEERLCLGSDYPFDMADPDPVGSVRAALGDRPGTVHRALEDNPSELLTRRPVGGGGEAAEQSPPAPPAPARGGAPVAVAALVALAVLVGAVAQRVSGMGFALVVAPVLVLVVGPVDGVLMVNICGALSACLVITRVWRLIDWRQYALLVVPALLAVVPGALVAARLGGPVLQVVIGVLVLAAITTSLVVHRADHVTARVPTALLTGAASGFMSATAGVSGPGASIYAVLTRWEHRQFAATIQPFFATLGAAAFLGKVAALPDGLPDYDWWLWPLILVSTVAGLTLGERLARVVSARAARRSVVALAYAGGVVALLDGAWRLAG